MFKYLSIGLGLLIVGTLATLAFMGIPAPQEQVHKTIPLETLLK
jgi:hypothetical protein